MNTQKRLENKIILITGASSGIGEALSREFIRRGSSVALCARRTERLSKLEQEFGSSRSLAIACDVRDPESLKTALQLTLKKWGRLDTVVANAGYGVVGAFDQLSTQDYRNQFETNVFGLLQTVEICLPEIKKTQGTIALMGSVASYISVPENSAYAMSKYSVRAFGEALYSEMKPHGVSVTLLSPGYIESEIRKVDNRGVFHDKQLEPLPSFLVISAEKAARQMVRAIAQKKREVVFTQVGKILVLVARFCPSLLRLAFSLGIRSRKEPKT